MAVLTFDHEKRRKYQEPQTTKHELLRPPPNTDEETEWTTPRGGPGLNDLYANNSTWSFNEIGNGTTAARPSFTPVKEEYGSQQNETFSQKRRFEYGDTPDPRSKRAREDSGQASRAVSTASSDDRWGRKTGVIDLTVGDYSSDEEEVQVFPERQFVPRAEDDNNATLYSRRKSLSPPRTFTRGLSPIAAHPRNPPIVHRSKPPIKPGNHKRTSVTPAAARKPYQIFNRATHSPALTNAQSSSTPPFKFSSVFPQEEAHAGSANAGPSVAPKPTATVPLYPRGKTVGPFVEEDDSDEDEPMVANVRPNVPRDSLTSLINRPRHDTPGRENLASALEESKRLREQAVGRSQSGLATPAHTTKSPHDANISGKPSAPEEDAVDASRDVPIPSIEFPPRIVAEKTQQPPVRSVQKEAANNAQTRHFSTFEGRRAVPEEPRKRQQTISHFHLQTKNKDIHQSPRDHHQPLIQRAQHDTKARNTTHGNGNSLRPALSDQNKAHNKAPSSAQHGQNESYQKNIEALRERIRLQKEKKEAQEERDRLQEAWEEREIAETKYQPPPQPDRRAALPDCSARDAPPPLPAAPPKPRPHQKKQPVSVFAQISADAKKAREKRERQLKSLQAKGKQAENDDSGAEAQREAEENHALVIPPPYRPLRPHKAQRPELDEELRAVAERAPVTPLKNPHRQLPEDYDDGDEEDPTNVETPEGPFAANSAAGVQAIKKSIQKPMNLPFDDDEMPQKTATQRFMGTGSTKITFKKSAPKSTSFYITASDLKLYKWRQDKVHWDEVVERWNDLGAEPQCKEGKLRRHLTKVTKAIEIEEISQALCQRVLDGDQEAEVELNRLAALHSADGDLANGDEAPFRKAMKPDPGRMVAPEAFAPGFAAPHTALSAPRPTQGGKVLDDAAYHALLANAREVWGPESDAEDLREESPIKEEDCVQWQYVMQRREFSLVEIEAHGFEQLHEETDWQEYDRTFEQVGEANSEACRYIFTTPQGSPEICFGAGAWNLRHEIYENDMIVFTLESTDFGVVQVRVARRLLTFKDYIIPSSKDGWISRTVYRIVVKKVNKMDELFGEAEQKEDNAAIEGAIYGSLDQANSVAIERWVLLTFKIRTANLDQRKVESIQEKERLQLELRDGGVGKAFRAEMEDDEKAVEVAVVECKYQGPRN